MRTLFLLSMLLSSLWVRAQQKEPQGPYKLPYILEGDDTIPVVNLPIVDIVESGADYQKNLKEYYRLRYNVIKVYPYARLAAIKVREMNAQMDKLDSEREKRRYRKAVEEQIRKDFEEQIKRLSINQGNVLIKLIDRETGQSSYSLIKELKGSFNAFFAQSLAKLFGHDLKDRYDPTGTDKTIENIVRQIETGQIAF